MNLVIERVTRRIQERSGPSRSDYLARVRGRRAKGRREFTGKWPLKQWMRLGLACESMLVPKASG